MSSVRTVRPRPLGADERIPVYWSGREAPPEVRAVDGGSLYRYLAAGTPKSGQKRQRGGSYQAPSEAPASAGSGQKQRKHDSREEARIHVPRARPVADYHLNVEALQPRPTFAATPGGTLSVPYVRWHPPPPGMYDDRPPEYDADEVDEAWLAQANAAVDAAIDGEEKEEQQQQLRHTRSGGGSARGASGAAGQRAAAGGSGGSVRGGRSTTGSGGLMAAARGLYQSFSSRFRSSGGGAGAAGEHEQEQPASKNRGHGAQGAQLGLSQFERAVEKLELLHFAAVSKWWSDMNDRPSTSAPAQAPKIPSTKHLLPRAHALEELAELIPDRPLAGQLYDHWLRRRQQHGGPLLERLWFEVPWKFVAFAHLLGNEDGDDELLPFMASESRSAKRRAGARRRVTDEDALEALHSLRSELEIVRTLADQVRKREKTKRLMLQLWQNEWRLRMQLGSYPPEASALRFDSRELPHWGHGIGHPLGRGGTSSRAPSRPTTPAADSDHERDDPGPAHRTHGSGGADMEPLLNRRGRPARAAVASANAGMHVAARPGQDGDDDVWALSPGDGGRSARAYAPPLATRGGGLMYAAGEGGDGDGDDDDDDDGPRWGVRRRRNSPVASPRMRRERAVRRRGTVTFARSWEQPSEGEAKAEPSQPPPAKRQRGTAASFHASRGRGCGRDCVPGTGHDGSTRQQQRAQCDAELKATEPPSPAHQQQRGRGRGRGPHSKQAAREPQQREWGADEGGADEQGSSEDGGGGSPEPGKLLFRGGVAVLKTPEGRVLFGASARSAAAGLVRRAAEQQAAEAQARLAAAVRRKGFAGKDAAAATARGRGHIHKETTGRGLRRVGVGTEAEWEDGQGSSDNEGVPSAASPEDVPPQSANPQPKQHQKATCTAAATCRGKAALAEAEAAAGTAAAAQQLQPRRFVAPVPPAKPVAAAPAPARKAGAAAAGNTQHAGRKRTAPAAEPKDSQSWCEGEPSAQAPQSRPASGTVARAPRPAAVAAVAVHNATVRARGDATSRGGRGGRGAAVVVAARHTQRRAMAVLAEAAEDAGHGPRGVGKRELRDLGINQDALEVAASWRHLFKPH